MVTLAFVPPQNGNEFMELMRDKMRGVNDNKGRAVPIKKAS